MPIRVLIACEESATIREAMAKRGYDAWSCDILPSRIPGKHIQDDVLNHLNKDWDLLIAHPDCTFLSNSGVHCLAKNGKIYNHDRHLKMINAAAFFRVLWDADINHICIENPVMHGYGLIEIGIDKANQTVQPFQFGHPESKRTCFWLKNLPKLEPTNVLPLPASGHWENQTPSGQNKLGPSMTRKRDRAKTYQGIADAMADQWGRFVCAAIDLRAY